MNVKKNVEDLQIVLRNDGWKSAGKWIHKKYNLRKLKFTAYKSKKKIINKEAADLYEGLANWHYYNFLKQEFKEILDREIPVSEVKSMTPKIIWWCWLQGGDKAPVLCQACLASLQRNFPDYEIRTVSLDNIEDYVKIPNYILDKFQQKKMGAAHFSDILRTYLLVEHGGIWIDSTVYASHRPDEAILKSPLFFYSTYMRQDLSMAGSSWLIIAAKNYPALRLVQKLLGAYWQKYDYAIHYFIFHFFFHMALEKYTDLWKAVPTYSNIPPHIMQKELFDTYKDERFRQICNMSAFHKLTHHKEAYPDGDLEKTIYGHIIKEFNKERENHAG